MTSRRDNFFLWIAVAIAATVFSGFWFTYFGPMFAGARAASAPVVHLHGWTFFAWYLLLVVQAVLARSRRMSLHRTLGGASIALALLMVASGLVVVGVRMAHAVDQGDPFWSASGPAVFSTLVLFAGFYAAALLLRRQPDWHKRLMIVASVGGMGAAGFRLCLVLFGPDWAMWLGVLGSNLFIVAGIVHDWRTQGRVHAAWWTGLVACVVLEAGVLLLTPTPVGQALSQGLAAAGRLFMPIY